MLKNPMPWTDYTDYKQEIWYTTQVVTVKRGDSIASEKENRNVNLTKKKWYITRKKIF